MNKTVKFCDNCGTFDKGSWVRFITLRLDPKGDLEEWDLCQDCRHTLLLVVWDKLTCEQRSDSLSRFRVAKKFVEDKFIEEN